MSTPRIQDIPFAVSGATGAVGSRVATRLAESGQSQRLVVRDAGRAPDLPGAEVAEASYEEPEAMEKALAGAETFFMVSASEAADRMRQHVATVDAAVAAGVKRIVHLSFLGAPRRPRSRSPGTTGTPRSAHAPPRLRRPLRVSA